MSALPRLFVVTDDEILKGTGFSRHWEAVLRAGGAGCALQLRAHGTEGGHLVSLARRIRAAAHRWGAQLWINDRVDVALAVQADGVQLGRLSLPAAAAHELLGWSCLIGRSVHDAEEAWQEDGDLAILGNLYSTTSHPQRRPLGLEVLRRAAAAKRPIVAIGGITPERVKEVVAAGAWGVAVMSGIWSAADPARAVELYTRQLGQPANGRAGVGD